MKHAYRLNLFADHSRGVMVVRPIGRFDTVSYCDLLFEKLESIASPWRFNRLYDFRRLDSDLSQQELIEIEKRWADLIAGHTYNAFVAIVAYDRTERLRIESACPVFANETVCRFNNFYEAMGWLEATNKSDYLTAAAATPLAEVRDAAIVIE